MSEFRPRYIARVEAVVPEQSHANASRMQAFTSYDYMGSAEFEFGAIPASLCRMRLHIANNLAATGNSGMSIIKLELKAIQGKYKDCPVYVLLSDDKRAAYGDSVLEKLTLLSERKLDCKEHTKFDDYFQTKWPYHGSEVDLWHDIRNDVFFAFNEALLTAVLAQLSTDIAITHLSVLANHFNEGDAITGVVSGSHVPDWHTVTGVVCGSPDATHVLVESGGVRYKISWPLVTSKPAGWALPQTARLLELMER
jgi:hypothetical protein